MWFLCVLTDQDSLQSEELSRSYLGLGKLCKMFLPANHATELSLRIHKDLESSIMNKGWSINVGLPKIVLREEFRLEKTLIWQYGAEEGRRFICKPYMHRG